GSMNCANGFRADGEISLVGARIGGQIRFSGAQLTCSDGPALNGDGLTATDIFCDDGFRADGGIRLVGASIDGQLILSGAQLDGKAGPAMNAQGLAATDMFCDAGFHAEGQVRLNGAKVDLLIDDKQSWPQRLDLSGFRYGGFDPYRPARERL